MKIRILKNISSVRGTFRAGDVVDWDETNAQSQIDAGNAEAVLTKKLRPHVPVAPTVSVSTEAES